MGLSDSPATLEGGNSKNVKVAEAHLAAAEEDTAYVRASQRNAFVRQVGCGVVQNRRLSSRVLRCRPCNLHDNVIGSRRRSCMCSSQPTGRAVAAPDAGRRAAPPLQARLLAAVLHRARWG